MSDSLLLLLWVAVPVLVAAGLGVAVAVDWAAWQMEAAAAHFQARVSTWRLDADERSQRMDDQRTFLQWLTDRAGIGSSGAVDEKLVEAHQQSQLIRILIEEEVPKAVMRCLETHRLTAKVTGASHYFEVAYDPDCYPQRAHVTWLLSHTVELVQAYPLRLDDPRLLHNSIVLRTRALLTCRRCPYIQLRVDEAPRLCPTAQLMQVQPATVPRP